MTQPSPEFQRSTRMPLEAVVRLHFEGTVAFQNGFAANVSATGMFVKHPDPPPLGTRLLFEFTVGSARNPVRGSGVVVWQREKYEGPGRPAGAGIRFDEVDEASRQALTEALFEFLESTLGDQAGDSPEMRALVDASSTHAPPASLDFGAAEAAGMSTRAIPAFPLPEAPAAPPDLGAPTPFRIFDDEPDTPVTPPAFAPPEEMLPSLSMPDLPAEPQPGPAVPPLTPYAHVDVPASSVDGSAAGAPAVAWAGAASSHADGGSGLGRVLALVAIVALLGGAGWWWYSRSMAPGQATDAPPAAVETAPAPAPRPEPLDPAPGPGGTLAENIGAVDLTRDPVTTTVTPAPAAPTAAAPSTTPRPTAAPASTSVPALATAAVGAPAVRVLAIQGEPTAGGMRILISGDGEFRTGRFSWSEIGGDKPRVLVRLRGIGEPYRGPVPPASTLVAGVRTGHHRRPEGDELHIVLDLVAAAPAAVQAVTAEGDRLVVDLAPR